MDRKNLYFAVLLVLWPGVIFTLILVLLELLINAPSGYFTDLFQYLALFFVLLVFTVKCHKDLGNVFLREENWIEAYQHYRIFLFFRPGDPDILNNIAITCAETGRNSRAIQYYLEAVRFNPAFYPAYNNLGLSFLDIGDWKTAMEYFHKGYRLKRGLAWNEGNKKVLSLPVLNDEAPVTGIHKLNHDIEQFSYLLEKGLLPDTFYKVIEGCEKLKDELALKNRDKFMVELNLRQKNLVSGYYGKNIYFGPAGRLTETALNSGLDFNEIQDRYFTNSPGFTWFDNFLSPAALKALSDFCLNSTIWHDCSRSRGYLAAYIYDGFSCELLFQVAEELRERFPGILKEHPLLNMWAFKYDSKMSGVLVHADQAAVNVNFWITPDTALKNPDSGGMIVYSEEAPVDWEFEKYNMDTRLIYEFLDREKATKFKVPHRQNRVVMFNSNLFHETDRLDFHGGYENRRINITLLFGKRQGK